LKLGVLLSPTWNEELGMRKVSRGKWSCFIKGWNWGCIQIFGLLLELIPIIGESFWLLGGSRLLWRYSVLGKFGTKFTTSLYFLCIKYNTSFSHKTQHKLISIPNCKDLIFVIKTWMAGTLGVEDNFCLHWLLLNNMVTFFWMS